jgi:hypothetical protein
LFGWFKSSDLEKRAKIVAEQMLFFRVITKKVGFSELKPSAERAGFVAVHLDPIAKDANFHWSKGEPEFLFGVSYESDDEISVIAEAYGDIFGLVLVSNSTLPTISVEVKASVAAGKNAVRFRKILLSFPGFDGGIDEMLADLGLGKRERGILMPGLRSAGPLGPSVKSVGGAEISRCLR